jgi:dipeptidyl-peptidase-4
MSRTGFAVAAMAAAWLWVPAQAQDRLKAMPGYEQFQKMSREIPGSVKLGSLAVQWKEDGSSFEYAWDGKRYHYDVATKQATAIGDAPQGSFAGGGRGRGGTQGAPARGRQFESTESPD